MKDIGLHIRLIDKITLVAKKAERLNLCHFQTFLINANKQFSQIAIPEQEAFLEVRPHFKELFLHASYWINCASAHEITTSLLEREIIIAEKLQFNYLVVHPGAISRYHKKEEGFELIAQRINHVLKKYSHIQILLENVAHTKRSIGGNLQDLHRIYEKIDQKNRIGFCLDTAHAHAFGYDLSNANKFVETLEQSIDLQKIKLIHLNDTQKECGSNIDVHCLPGKGKIGKQILQHIMNHPKLAHALIILEPPNISEEKELSIIKSLKK